MRGRLVILSGPSAVGKDTLIRRWRDRNPRVERVITCTTRAPREGEVNGKDYYFLSRQEFIKKRESGELLESEPVYTETLYGTPKADVERLLSEGKIAVLNIDVKGAKNIKRQYPDALTVFILPPSLDELRNRLLGRNPNEDPVRVQERLKRAEMEIAESDWYEVRIVNDDIDRAVDQLEAAVS
ncbi:MAG: guanylate kinase [Armatimonadetes bacterium]|nr:MAG: guanylate kinase [Armatimonadota bacterium]